MSLAQFEHFLLFAERAIAAKSSLPPAIDADEFESALVSHGIVLLHSQMEQCLRNAIDARCNRCSDLEVRAFALSVRDEKTGRIGLDSLKDTLRRFSDSYKLAFKSSIDSFIGKDSWESVKNQRISIAHHGNPATCSLADLRAYFEDVRQVLGYFCLGLGLNASEITVISALILLPSAISTSPMPP